jgi:hypothetical protein
MMITWGPGPPGLSCVQLARTCIKMRRMGRGFQGGQTEEKRQRSSDVMTHDTHTPGYTENCEVNA